jgi:hypothetical protein
LPKGRWRTIKFRARRNDSCADELVEAEMTDQARVEFLPKPCDHGQGASLIETGDGFNGKKCIKCGMLFWPRSQQEIINQYVTVRPMGPN